LRATHQVRWAATEHTFERRLERYEAFPLRPEHLEVHWFSIINSVVTVLLLTGFLATILMRVLKADFAKFSRDEGGLAACGG
jgi:transmembrane 9 superfamily member 1